MSLKYRVALVVLILEVCMVSLVLYQSQKITTDLSLQQSHKTAEVFLNILSDIARYNLINEEYADIQSHFENLSLDPTVDEIYLFDREGTIVASTNAELLGTKKHEDAVSSNDFVNEVEIENESGKLGKLHIDFSNTALYAAKTKALTEGSLYGLLGIGIIAIVGIALGTFVVKKIETLRDTLLLVQKSGKFDPIPSSGNDEISELTRIFNNVFLSIKEKTEALEESKSNYKRLVESSSTIPWEFDLFSGEFTYVGHQINKVLGFSQDSWKTLEDWANTIVPDERDSAVEFCMSQTKEGKDHIFEYRMKDTNGNIKWILDDVAVHMGEEGPVRLSGYMFDVTDQKEAQENLKKQHYYLTKAQEMGHIGTWELDLINNSLVWTDENCRIFGVPEGSVVDYQTFLTRVHPDDVSYVDKKWKEACSGEPYDIEHRLLIEGKTKWVREKARIDFDANGTATKAIGFTQDITDQKDFESRLELSELRFSTAFHKAPIMLTISSLEDGRYIDVNDRFCQVSGFDRDEAIGKTSIELGWITEDDRQELAKTIKNNGSVHDIELILTSKNGEKVYSTYSGEVIEIEGERRLLSLALDISKRVKAEADKEILEEQIRQTQKLEAIGTLAGGIAHDFNNILGSVLGYSTLLSEKVSKGSEEEDYVAEILRAGRRAKDLVTQILTFSRREKEAREPVQVHLVVGEALKMLRQTIPSNIEISQNINKAEDTVLADPTRLHQIIMNLCTNAYQAIGGRNGSIAVNLHTEEIDRNMAGKVVGLSTGKYVIFSVEDNGSGMSPETMARVFEPFYTTKDKGKGTGMGMSVVHGIVKDCGGAIDIRSQLGNGTKIDIYLPYFSGDATEKKSDILSLPTGNEKILIVDDEPALAKMTAKMLSSLGYLTDYRSSSREAYQLVREDPLAYDLVLTDQTMPEITGSMLTEEFHNIRNDLPVIICTGFSESLTVEKAEKIGVSALLNKPLEKELLSRVIREVLDKRPLV